MSDGKTVTLKYFAAMSCGGCSSAITRIAKKIEGVQEVKCDVAKKEVLITGTMDEKYLTSKLMKWSKASSKEVKLVETTPAQA